ncbi:DUF3558 domain-containing protein [Nocardia nova]|uniref:DUF3558 domain-containing protein n=1 Tax=Nocardia nova TaxID=37330 RepID=UPI0009E09CA1|nr:DUF3558 domain-containing protein [Nocardia nova]
MSNWWSVARGVALGFGVVALVSACNSGGGSTASSQNATAMSTIASDVPAGFDACQIPASVVQDEHLKNKGADSQDGAGGIKWRGCRWVQAGGDGYGATIDSSNITLAMVRANKDFVVDGESTVAGRSAVTSHVNGQDSHAACVINVEIQGGSLEISVNNPPSARDTGAQDSCDIAKRLADEIVPAIPAGL